MAKVLIPVGSIFKSFYVGIEKVTMWQDPVRAGCFFLTHLLDLLTQRLKLPSVCSRKASQLNTSRKTLCYLASLPSNTSMQ